MAEKDILKACQRCGWTGLAPASRRRCRFRLHGRNSDWCGGDLRKVKAERPVRERVAVSPQELAAKKAARARLMIVMKTRQLGRLATSLRQWERKAAHYTKRAEMTDEQVAQEKARRLAKPKTVRRSITLAGSEGAGR